MPDRIASWITLIGGVALVLFADDPAIQAAGLIGGWIGLLAVTWEEK